MIWDIHFAETRNLFICKFFADTSANKKESFENEAEGSLGQQQNKEELEKTTVFPTGFIENGQSTVIKDATDSGQTMTESSSEHEIEGRKVYYRVTKDF